MRLALDTNILLYGEGLNGPAKQGLIRNLLTQIGPGSLLVSTQVLAEFFRALTRKFEWPVKRANLSVTGWQASARCVPIGRSDFDDALTLATVHQFQIFDAMVVCAAAGNGCSVLLSEDMHHGFVWRGCVIVNPFAEQQHPALQAALKS